MAKRKKGALGSLGKGFTKFLGIMMVVVAIFSVYLTNNNKVMIGFLDTFVEDTDVYKVGEKINLGQGSLEIKNVLISGAGNTKVSFDLVFTNGTTEIVYLSYMDVGTVMDERSYYNMSSPDPSIATIMPGKAHTFKVSFERDDATQGVYYMTGEKLFSEDDDYQASFDFSGELNKEDGTKYKTKSELHNDVVGEVEESIESVESTPVTE